MKRQSKAEEALAKQSKTIQGEIDFHYKQRDEINTKLETLVDIRQGLDEEIARLYNARVAASKRNLKVVGGR